MEQTNNYNIDEIIKEIDEKIEKLKQNEKNAYDIFNIKYTYFPSNTGLKYIGLINSFSISISKDRNGINKVISYSYISKDESTKTNTYKEVLSSNEVLNTISNINLCDLKNNYFTNKLPIKLSHWELEYNNYFKICGTKDQKPLEITEVENALDFTNIFDKIKSEVEAETKINVSVEERKSNIEEQNKSINEIINKINNSISELNEKIKEELLNKEGDLTKEEQAKLGEVILECYKDKKEKQIIDLSEKVPSLNAVYVCVKERGGNAIIVNSKKEYLTATSSVNFDRHLQEFINGRRTEKK